jgi:hypothetical protein
VFFKEFLLLAKVLCSSIGGCGKIGNHLKEDLAKSGYKP